MTKDKALALALNALHTKGEHHPRVYAAIAAIQTVLAQQVQEPWPAEPVGHMAGVVGGMALEQQEPVLWEMPDGKIADKWALQFYSGQKGKPLYTAPPQRQWQGLTDGDWEWVADKKETSLDTFAHGAAWAADQLKEKNT